MRKIDEIRQQMVADALTTEQLQKACACSDADVARWFLDVDDDEELLERIATLGERTPEPQATDAQFDCLAVTSVQVFPFKESGNNMKAMANVVLNDQLLLRGLRIMDGANGLYVGMPNDPFYKGEDFRTIFNPITRQLREHIENCVLVKYQLAIKD